MRTFIKIKYSIYVYTATFIVLGISFVAHYSINRLKDVIESKASGSEKSGTLPLNGIRILAFLVTCLVVFVNFSLGKIIRLFSSYQRLSTYSEYHLTVAVQLSIAMFINTGIVPLIINLDKENWFIASGLVVDIFFNIIGVSFIAPLTYVFDPMYLIRLCKQRKAQKLGQKSQLSQHELNVLFEGPVLDMAQRYSNLMLLFMLTVFYTPLIPITPLFTGLGALLQYWIEKYMLLKVHCRPETLGAFMPSLVSSALPPFIILYGLSNYLFLNQLRGDNTIGFVSFIFSIGYLLVPAQYLVQKFLKDVERPDNKTYQLHMLDFNTDYDRENPVTDEEATMNYLKKIEQDANLQKLDLIKQKTERYLKRDTLGFYAKRETVQGRAGLYLNHNASAARASYQVGLLFL